MYTYVHCRLMKSVLYLHILYYQGMLKFFEMESNSIMRKWEAHCQEIAQDRERQSECGLH